MPEQLVDFLLARLTEDEEAARAASADERILQKGGRGQRVTAGPTSPWLPSRVLAEIDAKRRIVQLLGPVMSAQATVDDGNNATSTQGNPWPPTASATSSKGDPWPPTANATSTKGNPWPPTAYQTLCVLALPYADHPDYQEEWRT